MLKERQGIAVGWLSFAFAPRVRRVWLALAILIAAPAAAATASAGTLTNVAPTGASAGISVKVNGTGFDASAANHQIQLTPGTGSPVVVTPTASTVVDASKGVRQLTFRVPAGLAPGTAAIRVTNTVTGEVSTGRSLEVVELTLPDVSSAARGSSGVVVRIAGSPNALLNAAGLKVSFGAGVTVTQTAVDSATSLRATLDIPASAAVGPRTIAITTPTQLLTLVNGFTVTAPAPPDETAPFVTVNAPDTALAGALVTVTALATDNVGVARVQFLVDNANPTEDEASPFERVVAIPADATPGTTFTVKATAIDAAGNTGSGEAVITVAATPDTTNPTVALNAPPHASPSGVVQISATATDNVGVASVTFLANDQPIATLTQPPYQTTYTIPAAAPVGSTITIVARATDLSGHTAQDSADITIVQAPDTTAPTVELSAPAQIGAGRTLVVSAVAADNVGVTSVQFFVDDVLIASDTQAPYDASFPVPADAAAGVVLKVRARAVDFAGLEAMDNANVTVLANRAPTANAGGPYTVQAGDLLQLTATSSSDPDGDALSYAWRFGDETGGGTDPTGTGPAPSHVYAAAGTFTATLTVSDGRGGSAQATAIVTVTPVADRGAPAITLVGPSRVLPGTQVTVIAQVTDNVGVQNVTFTINGANATVATAAPYTRVVDVPAVAAPGTTMVVQGVAKDAAGNTTPAQLTLTITKSPDTLASVVAMHLPARTSAGATLIVGAAATDDSGVRAVTFFAGTTAIGTDDSAPYEAVYTVPQGTAAGTTLTFTARASDFGDNVGEATGTVPVAATGDTTAPTVFLTVPPTVAAGSTLHLDANAQDEGGIAAVEFFLDAVKIAVDTAAPYQVDYALPASRVPGALLRVQARAVDFAGLDATVWAESRVTAAGQGVITGDVFDATTGLPLAGASIALAGQDAQGQTYAATTTSDARGRYLLRAQEGDGRLQITKAGWTTVIRVVDVTTGRAVEPVDARLTPLAPLSAPIQPVVGGLIAQDGHEATLPGGALAATTALRLTPIGPQALQALLPGGWSPLAAIDLAPRGITFGTPVAIRAPQARALTVATEVLLARWDEETATWRAVSVVPITGDGRTLAGEIPATGQYAWLLPDTLPTAPIIPAAGLEVTGVDLDTLPEAAVTVINPQPKVLFYQPGVRSIVGGTVTHAQPLSSGLVLRTHISEDYHFFSGAEARPEPITADVVFYQTTAAGTTLASSYPVTPSLPFEAVNLKEGVIGVELYAPAAQTEELPLIGQEGGSATAPTGERLQLPPGATTETTPFRVQGLPASELGIALPSGVTLAGGVTLDFTGELTASGVVSVARPADLPAGSRVLFARIEEIDSASRFVLAGVGRIDNDRLISDIVVPGATVTLEGVRRAGRYVFLRVASPIAFFTGTVTGATGSAPHVNALITTNRLPAIVSRSGTDGRYLAASLTGATTLTARDLVKHDTGTAEGTVNEAWSVATLALQLVAQRPAITSISPGANAVDVPLSTAIVVKFSEPIDPASLAGGSGARITVTRTGTGGGLVPASATLSANDTTVTLRPQAPLAPNATYTIAVDAAIADLSGYTLVAGGSATFESLDVQAPKPPQAGDISARIPTNGMTTVSGTQGSVNPRDRVLIVNKRTGVIVPATVGQDGSFTGQIAALLTDKIEIRIIDQAGNETLVAVSRFGDPDGRVVVGPEGGDIEVTPGGLKLSVQPGTFPQGAIVKFTALAAEAVNPTVPVGTEYPLIGGFEIDANVAPQRYMNVSFPAPSGATASSTGIVAEVVQVYGQRALSIVDTAKMIDGRMATSSPPCEGIVNKFGRYAMYMNEHAQMRLGIALLSMTVPQHRPVVLAPFVITNPFLPYPPTILHPGMQFEQLYNPATPFIRYIRQTGDVEGGLNQANSATPVCFPVPPDTQMRVVVRDGQTGELVQSVSQTSPGVGQEARITTIYVAPGDEQPPTVLWTSWNPRAPYVLDSGKPIQVQFSEPVTVGAPPGEDAAYLVNQITGARTALQTRIGGGARVVTFLPQGALPIGSAFTLHLPGLTDFSGNLFQGVLTFKTFEPALILPGLTDVGVTRFTKQTILTQFGETGGHDWGNTQTVALSDIDFVTRSPEESADGKWHTQLFGIGAGREFGFQILSIDASQPRQPRATAMLRGTQRFYNQMKVIADIGLKFRTLPNGDSREPALAAWRARELHYLVNDPTQRICAVPGDARITAWRARQEPGATFAMSLGCGTIGLATSHNTYYSLLHMYDLTNPAAPTLLSQRLLSDGGALAGYPPKPEAPAVTGGAARSVDLIAGVDFTHSANGQNWVNQDATAAFVAVFGSGITALDLGHNIPEPDFRDRPPSGTTIESLQHWTFPYYQDVATLRGRVVAIAHDQWDGTGTAHLEVFDAGLQPIGAPLQLPHTPFQMTTVQNLLTFDEDDNGATEEHDFALVSGKQGVAIAELRPDGGAQLVGFVPMPNAPREDQGPMVSEVQGTCPNLTFKVGDITVHSNDATVFRRGTCTDVAGGARVTVITVPNEGWLVTELTFLERPALILVDSLRHIEIDREAKIAYVAGSWKKFDATYDGFVVIDLAIPYGGFTDRDNDGWDDRIRGFVPVAGVGLAIQSGRLNGFRFDPRRKLIYAAIDGEPNDYNEANLAILRTCECGELQAMITLESGGAGTGPDRPSPDGSTTTIYVTPEMLASGQFRARFDIDSFSNGDVHYSITEMTSSGDDADRLLDLSNGGTGTLSNGSQQILLALRPIGSDPRSSVIAIDFTDAEGNFLKRAILHLIPTNVMSDTVKVRTFIDRTNQEIYETPGYLTFALNHDARVTIRVDGQVITPPGDGQTPGTPFLDVPLPAGWNRVLITRPMVSVPGEHTYEIRAVYDEGVTMVRTGKAIHDVVIDESLPIGHTFIKGVDLSDGHLTLSREDFAIAGVGPSLQFSRTYSSIGNRSSGVMGAGWSHNWLSRLSIDAYGRISISGGEGSGMRFSQTDGSASFPGARVFKPQAGYHGQLVYTQGAYDYYTKGRSRYHYELAPSQTSDPDYRLTYIEDSNGNRLTLTYTGEQLTKVTDAAGRSLTFTYANHASEERIVRVEGPLDLVLTYEYDTLGNLTRTVRGSRIEQYAYTVDQPRDRHNLQRVTDPNGRFTDYTYFAQGDPFPGEQTEFQWGRDILQIPLKYELVKRVTEGAETPEAATTTFAYDYSQLGTRYLTTVTDPKATQTRYTLNARGAVSEVRVLAADGAGDNVTTMRWSFEDGINDVYMTRKVEPSGRVIRYEYDARGNMTREIIEANVAGYAPVADASGQAAAEVITRWEYEPKFNRLVKKTDPEGNVTEYEIDQANGNVLSVTTDPRDGGQPIVSRTTYGSVSAGTGQLHGLLRTTTDGRGHVTTYRQYDAWGNPTEIEDAEGHVTTQVFDARGRMTDASDTMGHRVTTEFDDLDRVTKITKYALNQPSEPGMASPDQVTTTTYFPGGEKKLVTDGLGHETEYEYDGLNRLRRQIDRLEDADGQAITLQSTWEYDGNGNKRLETDRRGIQRRFTFDAMNRQRKVEVVDGNGEKTISEQEYDAYGNLTADVDLHGHRTTYEYDALYRKVKVNLPLAPYVLTMGYDLAGNELRVSDANGNVLRRTFDGLNRKRTVTDAAGNIVRYTWDAANNPLTETHERTGLVRTYGPYDKVNRPLGSALTFTDPVTQQTVTYTTSSEFLDAEHAVITTNPRGFKVKEVLNGFDKPATRTVDPDGLALTTTFRYDANGNEAAVRDAEGDGPDVVRTFDGLNRKVRSEYPLDGVERIYYDGNDNVVRTIDRRGIEMRHEYDALDRKTADILIESISNAGEALTLSTIAYDDAGLKTTTTDAKGQATVVEYDALHHEVKRTDPLTHVTTFTWDGVNKRSMTSPRGLKNEFAYDVLNRLVAVREFDAEGTERSAMSTTYDDTAMRQIETDRMGSQRILQFDQVKRLRRVTRRHPDLASAYGAAEIVLEQFRYDGNGNLVESVNANGHVTQMTFDAADRRRTVIEGAGSPVAATTTTTYDKAGNVLTVKDGRAHGGTFDLQTTYDARNRPVTQTNGEGRVFTYTYDQADQVVTATEPRGEAWTTRYTYDELGQLLAVDERRGDVGGVTRFRYDANRNKVAQQDANGNLTTYAHDARNRITDTWEHSVAGTLGDTVTRGGGEGGDRATALHWHYEHDADGNERLVVDAEGQQVTKAYDHLNRLVRKDYANHRPAADGSVIYPQIVSIVTTLDRNGNATRVEEVKRRDAANTVTEVTVMAYDPLNRMTSRTNADNRTVGYRYDRQGNRLSVTDADNVRTSYTYDERNRVATATAEGDQVTRYAYWPDSLLRSTTHPNGTVSEQTFDRADRLVKVVSHGGDVSAPIAQHDYEYDENGNTRSQTERHRLIDAGAPQQTTYDYDALNRLTGVHYPGNASVAYTLAANGNRLTEVGTHAGTGTGSGPAVNREYIYNRVNQLTRILDRADAAASMTFAYDKNGNTREQRTGTIDGDVIANPTATKRFDFDIRDKLAAVIDGSGQTRFDYDFTGLRTRKSGPMQVGFLYDEGALLQEYDTATGVTLTKYHYGAGLLSMVSVGASGRESLYYSVDGQRSTSELTDGSGTVRASYAYDAFGNLRRSADTTANRRRYTGHYDDTETGLQYFGARYYDPAIGRFISQDPYSGSEDLPPSLHRYAYAHGNPLAYGDPTGYEAESFTRDLGNWSKGIVTGVATALTAPVAGMLESGVKGLADITMAGVGYLAIEATGGKYLEEIGALLQPVSTIGQAAAEKGTITAIRESATGFVKDTVKGTVTLPSRIIEASLSGDPELLGATMVEVVQTGQGMKAPLKKIMQAPVVRLKDRVVATKAILMRERVSKRGYGDAAKEVTGTITVMDAWELAGACVEKGAHGCGFVGGLRKPSAANLAKNWDADKTVGRGMKQMEDGKYYKYSGDVDFMQYRKGADSVMNNPGLADRINQRTSVPMLDTFKEHGVMGEFLPPDMVPFEVKQLWWKQQNLPPNSPIRAFDYMSQGVTLPDSVPLYDGKGARITVDGPKAFILKKGKPGVTARKLETDAFEFINKVHVIDEMPLFPTVPDFVGMGLRTTAIQNQYEKRRAK